jgi:CRISPR-associated protein Cas2
MRLIIMFDLPMTTKANVKNYTKFRKYLIRSGFIMMQESVYTKLTLNATAAEFVMKKVRANKPPEGLVQMLMVTEKQFSKIEYIVGDKNSDVIDSAERMIVL